MQRTLSIETPSLVGQTVKVAGWAASTRDHGGLIFIDLRDHTGIVQLTVHPEDAQAFKLAGTIHDEFVISATGTVINREASLVNNNIPTGTVEIIVKNLEILNTSKPLPFPIMHQTDDINEELRLKYRFLDLRRDDMQSMIAKRHAMIKMIRDYMDGRGFVEISTPILTSSSPEGARDFLVPSRLHPGQFYALPQAPQQFKQLLMVAGVPKYFQIAPCFRDEDPRADRSPGEFYQLDLEIGFATHPEEVFSELDPLFITLTEDFAGKKVWQKPIPRIPYKEAMEKYGSDKPDLRFGMELVDLTEELANTEFSVFGSAIKAGGIVKAICVQGGATLSRSQIDELTELVRKEGAGGLAYIVCDEPHLASPSQGEELAADPSPSQGEEQMQNSTPLQGHSALSSGSKRGVRGGLRSPILKFLKDDEVAAIIQKTGAQTGDIIFFGADARSIVNKVLGKLRSTIGDIFGLKDASVVAWAWITDFPMYEYNEREKKIDFSHNPFSMPQGGLEALDSQDPLEINAYQYDIVANGLELSSGAIRNHRPDIMYKAFEIAGISKETVDEKFGAMIRAFEYGTPPHGGCAPGVDRMLMLFEDEPNIREVIAFPKNGSAQDVMMNAPATVDEKQLKELHIKLDLPKEKK